MLYMVLDITLISLLGLRRVLDPTHYQASFIRAQEAQQTLYRTSFGTRYEAYGGTTNALVSTLQFKLNQLCAVKSRIQ